MKVRVKGSIDEVEVGQFRKNTKDSALKAYFSVITYSKDNEYLKAQKIRNCRYFEQGDSHWISFPQEEVNYKDGRKKEYFPIVSQMDKAYDEQHKIAILKALKEFTGSKDGEAESPAPTAPESPVQSDTSPLPF